jgi:hypothetical protein
MPCLGGLSPAWVRLAGDGTPTVIPKRDAPPGATGSRIAAASCPGGKAMGVTRGSAHRTPHVPRTAPPTTNRNGVRQWQRGQERNWSLDRLGSPILDGPTDSSIPHVGSTQNPLGPVKSECPAPTRLHGTSSGLRPTSRRGGSR